MEPVLIVIRTSSATSFDTKFGINHEHFTQRTRDLAIDSEPKLNHPFVWQMHDLHDHPVIMFSSVELYMNISNHNVSNLVTKKK